MPSPPPIPANEAERLQALHELRLLDTPAEERFDRITRLARRLFAVPTVLISLVDAERQWFKSALGMECDQTSRAVSFCAHAILEDNPLMVEDASLDARFADNPLVTGAPFIRSYLGMPLRGSNGYRVGTLCLIDSVPRCFTPEDLASLYDLRFLVEAEFHTREQSQTVVRARLSEARLATALRLQEAVVGMPDLNLVGIDLGGRIQLFSKGAERLLGYRATDVIDKLTLADLHDPQELDAHARDLSAALGRVLPTGLAALLEQCRHGAVVQREWMYMRRGGQRRRVQLTISGIFSAHRTLTGLLCMATDLGEAHRADTLGTSLYA